MDKEKELSRRDFLKGAAVAGAGAATLGLVGCGNTDGADDPSGQSATDGLPEWTHEADVVVCGGGMTGLVAAIRAKDLGASVIVIEANYACGGHALLSGGHMHLGGGTTVQKAMGVVDTPDMYYIDHTSPVSVKNKYNIREVVRATAEVHPAAFDLLLENGWTHKPDDTLRIMYADDSVPRSITTDKEPWVYCDPIDSPSWNNGVGLTRPLEKSAREKGVEFIMNHHMDKIYREASGGAVMGEEGNVVGIMASYTPRIMPGKTEPLVDHKDFLLSNIDSTETVYVKANKAVVVATGGSSSNWEFHSFFDPRFGPEHGTGRGGDPFSFTDGSGEIAILDVGGSIGATMVGIHNGKVGAIGTQYGYYANAIGPKAALFPEVRSVGLNIMSNRTREDGLIFVNMLGERFYKENVRADAARETEDGYFDALMGSVLIEENGVLTRKAGSTWAIFDDAWAKTCEWDVSGPPSIDYDDGYFYKADTIEELAGKIVNKFYEQHKMPPANLVATVERYNSFVDTGVDEDFGRDNPSVKIETPPFYAAWTANTHHDTLVGVLVNENLQCLDAHRRVIPHLYAGGECSAGQGMHGHGKNCSNGYLIGTRAVEEPSI
jgi:hypothetical protein